MIIIYTHTINKSNYSKYGSYYLIYYKEVEV